MMRKRINRCRNTVWDISVISRNKNGETLCGDQCALEWDGNDATVILSDGLGSGSQGQHSLHADNDHAHDHAQGQRAH